MTPWHPSAHGPRPSRTRALAAALALAVAPGIATAASGDRDWPIYHGDPEGTHYSPLARIHRGNVAALKPVWVYRSGDHGRGASTTIECNPLIIDGTLYGTTPGLKVFALDATTGRELWHFDPWDGRPGRGVNRGLAWWSSGDDRRLYFAAGVRLYALNARTGRPVAEFGQGGFIDLREGLDQDVFHLSVNGPTPGVVYNDLLILGSAIPDTLPPTAPGHIRAYDARTGERRWIFHTIPHPGEPGHETWPPDAWRWNGGANAWGGLTLDVARGIVFCGTGSPTYDHYGGDRPGANLYANCVLALDADTGALRWHFQVVHHDLWDYDLPCPPVLVTLRRNGRRIDAAAQVTKTGHVFVFDRVTGQPVFPIEERPVPASDIPGEKSWPTQPIPARPPPFARQGLSIEDATDVSEAARAAVRERLRGMRSEGLFTPPSTRPTVVMPQFNGGAEWGGAAVDPTTGWLFINASNEPEWIQMFPAKPRETVTLKELGAHLHRVICASCHGADRVADAEAGAGGVARPSLRDLNQRMTRAEVEALLETGRGQMPSFASLSAIERAALTAFLLDEGGNDPAPLGKEDLSWANQIPWVANGHPELRDPDGRPASARPWGTLTAIDLNEGELVWQKPLGHYPGLERVNGQPSGTFNIGGPLVTGGGLVFIGAAMDEKFRAFDAASGEILWEHTLDAGAYATPATFQRNGRQYVVVAAGGGGKPGTRSGDGWWCFSLPDEPSGTAERIP